MGIHPEKMEEVWRGDMKDEIQLSIRRVRRYARVCMRVLNNLI